MVARLGEIALERGLRARWKFRSWPAQRNRPALLFLESIATAGPDGVFRLAAAEAAATAVPSPAQHAVDAAARRGAAEPVAAAAPGLRADRHANCATAATSWSRCGRQLRAVPTAAASGSAAHARWNASWRELWAELLNVTAVGVHDNFFELGGHSLLAVQLLSRVRQIYGVDLSLEVVY